MAGQPVTRWTSAPLLPPPSVCNDPRGFSNGSSIHHSAGAEGSLPAILTTVIDFAPVSKQCNLVQRIPIKVNYSSVNMLIFRNDN